jgi:hypothetical protein
VHILRQQWVRRSLGIIFAGQSKILVEDEQRSNQDLCIDCSLPQFPSSSNPCPTCCQGDSTEEDAAHGPEVARSMLLLLLTENNTKCKSQKHKSVVFFSKGDPINIFISIN